MRNLIAQLTANFQRPGAYKPFIDYIRFPRFRNLEADTRIDFAFPVTVFVGQNGCGKSSVLQALYGCPKLKSVSDYWFNTEVDPIVEQADDNRNCLIYSYDRGGAEKEVLKRRSFKTGQHDLWDTSAPLAKYGMDPNAARVPPIEKNVVYLNFRSSQSAFEKAFHEETPPRSGIQDWLRGKSAHLKRVLRGGGFKPFGHILYRPGHNLTANELSAMSSILGRTYNRATLLEHRLYGHWGYSVIFDLAHAKYSEAFAGSGETNVAILVHQLCAAPRNSLILLDEPETSLHPGAQKRLLEFILQQTVEKAHQVVICTHSSVLVGKLPREAVKVFHVSASGAFRVKGNVLPYESFHFLGDAMPDKRTVIVEDRLALIIFETVLAQEPAKKAMIDVQHFFGGARPMKQDAAVYMREKPCNRFLVFDGTERPVAAIFDPSNITDGQKADLSTLADFLGEKIREAAKAEIQFAVDSVRGGGNKRQRCALQCDYLRYLRTHVFYLPFDAPEDVLWDDQVVRKYLEPTFSQPEIDEFFASITDTDSKAKFAELTSRLVGQNTAEEIAVVHRLFANHWIRDTARSAAAISKIREIIDQIISVEA